MTDEEICTLLDWNYQNTDCGVDGLIHRIKRVIEEAQRQERERCAKVCEEQTYLSRASLSNILGDESTTHCHIAAAIRELK